MPPASLFLFALWSLALVFVFGLQGFRGFAKARCAAKSTVSMVWYHKYQPRLGRFERFLDRPNDPTMSTCTGGEQNVNRLISANASFTRQRDDARRTKQLAEERFNLVKRDSE